MSLIIFDTETGGLEPKHPTIQIAAIAVDAVWNEIDRFERKILFDVAAATPEALNVNSFDEFAWDAQGVRKEAAISDFAAFLSQHASVRKVSQRTGRPYTVARLCGHNIATFDKPRLDADFRFLGVFLPADYGVMDTLQLWRWLQHQRPGMPDLGKLSDIATFYGIDAGDAHDAMADCRLVAAIAPRILADLAKGCAA